LLNSALKPDFLPAALPLRTRLFLGLLLVNAVVLGVLAIGSQTEEAARNRKQQDSLREMVRERLSRFDPGLQQDLAGILAWPLWATFEEVLIVDQRVLELGGRPVPVGAFINPLGNRHRARDFPIEEITAAVADASLTGVEQFVAGGVAMPLHMPSVGGEKANAWGGVYVRQPGGDQGTSLAWSVALAAAAATLMSTLLIWFMLRREVLVPIEALAGAAHSFGEGKRPALPRTAQAEEVTELVAAFDSMLTRIDGFRTELEAEVDLATDRAQEAERQVARQHRLAAMGTLAAGVAHEINSPLAGAMQGVKVMQESPDSPRAARYGPLVSEALERIGVMVRRLLTLAPVRPEEGSCQVGEVLAALPDFLASRLVRHRLEIQVEPPGLTVGAAAGDFLPMVLNLVQNSLDALDQEGSEAEGVVKLHCQASDSEVVLEVADNGPGAPPELLPQLLEPFISGKEDGQGTGLGLSLVQATATQLGGGLRVENRDSGGFRATLRLPRQV